jgi:hypothetical protein
MRAFIFWVARNRVDDDLLTRFDHCITADDKRTVQSLLKLLLAHGRSEFDGVASDHGNVLVAIISPIGGAYAHRPLYENDPGSRTVLMLFGCTTQLSRSSAADLLQRSPDGIAPTTLKINLGYRYPGEEMLATENKVESLGYLTVKGPLPWAPPYYPYVVQLTPKGEEATRTSGWTLGEKGSPPTQSQTLTIPLGAVRIIEVTGLTTEEKKATADFTFQVDYNQVGKALGLGTKKETGRRQFILYDDGWRLSPVGL